MNLAEIIESRRTIHSYKTDKVPDAWVLDALRVSLWAPNHRLTHPWAYFWIGDQARIHLAELYVEIKSAKKPLDDVQKKAAHASITNASHFILLGLKKTAGKEEDPAVVHENYATLACSVQLATLFLWEKGVGSKWTTGGFTNHPRTYEILGVNRQEVQLEGGLFIGVPQVVPTASQRPPLETVLRRV